MTSLAINAAATGGRSWRPPYIARSSDETEEVTVWLSTSTGRLSTTTDAGAPVESDEHSLTVGPDGPVLLQDCYLIEQMANVNRQHLHSY